MPSPRSCRRADRCFSDHLAGNVRGMQASRSAWDSMGLRTSWNLTSKGNGTMHLVCGSRGTAREQRQVRVRFGQRRPPRKSIGVSVTRHLLTNRRDLLRRRPRASPTVAKHPDRHAGQVAEDDASRITVGRCSAATRELCQVLADDLDEPLGRVEQPTLRCGAGAPAHEDRVDNRRARAVNMYRAAHLRRTRQ